MGGSDIAPAQTAISFLMRGVGFCALGWPLETCRNALLAERAIGSSGTDGRFRAHSNTRTLVFLRFGVGSSGADGRFRYCSSSNSNLIPDAWSQLLCRHLEAPIIDARLTSWVASAVSRLLLRSATLVYMGTTRSTLRNICILNSLKDCTVFEGIQVY